MRKLLCLEQNAWNCRSRAYWAVTWHKLRKATEDLGTISDSEAKGSSSLCACDAVQKHSRVTRVQFSFLLVIELDGNRCISAAHSVRYLRARALRGFNKQDGLHDRNQPWSCGMEGTPLILWSLELQLLIQLAHIGCQCRSYEFPRS